MSMKVTELRVSIRELLHGGAGIILGYNSFEPIRCREIYNFWERFLDVGFDMNKSIFQSVEADSMYVTFYQDYKYNCLGQRKRDGEIVREGDELVRLGKLYPYVFAI